MKTSDFDYNLPEELIAQEPAKERDLSRLLVMDRDTGAIEHRLFRDIKDYLRPGDLLVFNDTKVTAKRLMGRKSTGAEVEALLMTRITDRVWEAMVRPARRLQPGTLVEFDCGLVGAMGEDTSEGKIITFDRNADEIIETLGETPLPPYIHKKPDDPGRYQTVYALREGSAAAPTAGLHFTQPLLKEIKDMGVDSAYVTLTVGIGTFRPVRAENIADHDMHSEVYEITPENAEKINNPRGRVICVGTTSTRALESAAVAKGRVEPCKTSTKLFVYPPYDFKIADCMITNFHIPKSTLLMLVSAFAGTDHIRAAYEEAVRERYRFLSFGDAMFLKRE